MFLENRLKRIKITEDIRKLIIKERTERNISATNLAKEKLHRPQSWIAQIENGRTQTIKCSDLLQIFSNILDVDLQGADNFLEDNLAAANTSMLSDAEEKVQSIHINAFKKYEIIEDETEREFRKQKRFIIHALNKMYEDVPEDAVKILRTFCANIKFDLPFIMAVASLPFIVLSDLEEDVNYEVYKKILDVVIEYANRDGTERIKRKSSINVDDDDFDDEIESQEETE